MEYIIELFSDNPDFIIDSNTSFIKITHVKHGDFNIRVKKHINGYRVEFYNSTIDYVSSSPISVDDAIIGIMYLLDSIYKNRDIDDETRELLNWE